MRSAVKPHWLGGGDSQLVIPSLSEGERQADGSSLFTNEDATVSYHLQTISEKGVLDITLGENLSVHIDPTDKSYIKTLTPSGNAKIGD